MKIFGIEINTTIILIVVGAFVLLFLICLAIANFAGENLLTVFQRYEQKVTGFTTAMNFSQIVSNSELNGRVRCQVIPGFLNDNYYNKVISLSERVANACNVAALSVCAHELGHALQYRDTPQKMKSFARKMIFSRVVSKVTFPFFIAGVICIFFNLMIALILLSLSAFTFICGLLAKLDTIKIEKEASENALKLLSKYADFDEEDIKCARKVLNAAKLTYVASFLKSVLAWTLLVRKYDFY